MDEDNYCDDLSHVPVNETGAVRTGLGYNQATVTFKKFLLQYNLFR